MQVQARKKGGDPVTVEINIPEKLADQVKLFGEDVVQSAAQGSLIITAQAKMRRLIDTKKSPKEIQDEMSKWKPDVRSVVKASVFEKAVSLYDKLTPEEQKALLSRVQAQAKGQSAPPAGQAAKH